MSVYILQPLCFFLFLCSPFYAIDSWLSHSGCRGRRQHTMALSNLSILCGMWTMFSFLWMCKTVRRFYHDNFFLSLSVDFRAYSKKNILSSNPAADERNFSYIDKSKQQKKGINFRRTQENTLHVHKSSAVLFRENVVVFSWETFTAHRFIFHRHTTVLKHIRRCKAELVAWKPKCRNKMSKKRGRGWAVALCCFVETKNSVIFGVHISGALKKKRFFEMKRDIWLKRKWCFYLYGERNENKQRKKDERNLPCEIKWMTYKQKAWYGEQWQQRWRYNIENAHFLEWRDGTKKDEWDVRKKSKDREMCTDAAAKWIHSLKMRIRWHKVVKAKQKKNKPKKKRENEQRDEHRCTTAPGVQTWLFANTRVHSFPFSYSCLLISAHTATLTHVKRWILCALPFTHIFPYILLIRWVE